jgi:hypothetical protein
MTSRGSTPAFVGRVPEVTALIEAFDDARAGRATTALVGGEAGVGKSRLVRGLGAHARRTGARVLVGHCLDLEEGGLPYAPFVDILRTLERELPADEGGATIGPLRAALGSPPADTGRTRGGPRPRPVRAGAGLRAVAQPRAQRAVAKANAGAWNGRHRGGPPVPRDSGREGRHRRPIDPALPRPRGGGGRRRPVVNAAFFDVVALLAEPTSLMRPGLMARVLGRRHETPDSELSPAPRPLVPAREPA